MRNGVVDTNSDIGQIREVLTGKYSLENRKDGWKVVKTPWSTVMERLCDPGQNFLPVIPPSQTVALVVYADGSEYKLIKPGQAVLVIEQKGFVRIELYGE